MAFNLPSDRKEVYNRIVSDFTAQIPDSGAFLPASYVSSILKSLANRVFDNYQKINLMIKEFFIQTASVVYIPRWGDTYGITRNPPVGSSGNIVLTGTTATLIPVGTTLQSASGISYTTQADTTISLNTVSIASMSRTGATVSVNFSSTHNLASGITVSITGATPSNFNATNVRITVTTANQFQFTQAGTAGSPTGTLIAQWTTAVAQVNSNIQGANTNITAGGVLTLSSPISGADNSAFIDLNEISGGTDQESADSYRARVLFRIQFPFSFFNKNAIIGQTKQIAGVTRVWVFSPDSTSAGVSISSITRNGQIATAISTAHGLVSGNYITVFGATQSEYNVVRKQVVVIDANTFAYVVSGSPATPATGTITASYSYVELGQVRVLFARDNDTSIIPSSTEINTVKDKLLEIKPAHIGDGDIIVSAPIAIPVNITFSTLSPNTTAMQTAITNSLTDFFKISNNVGQNITLADLNGLISRTIDGNGNVPIYTLSSPSVDTAIGLNKIGTLGAITYA